MRRDDVASTSKRRHFCTKFLLGKTSMCVQRRFRSDWHLPNLITVCAVDMGTVYTLSYSLSAQRRFDLTKPGDPQSYQSLLLAHMTKVSMTTHTEYFLSFQRQRIVRQEKSNSFIFYSESTYFFIIRRICVQAALYCLFRISCIEII